MIMDIIIIINIILIIVGFVSSFIFTNSELGILVPIGLTILAVVSYYIRYKDKHEKIK